MALGLMSLGITKGDRVGIWAPNLAEWALVQYGTARIGAILVNLNPAYRTNEVQYALAQSQCKTVITISEFKTSDYRGMLARVRPDLPSLEHTIFVDDESWCEMLKLGEKQDISELLRIEASLDFDDPINIQYTSGTTGRPKGATLSHFNILNNGYFVGELCSYTQAEKVCIPVPYYHCFGMVMGNLACTSHGAAMVLPSPSFDPLATLKAVAEERCTSLYGVPTMFIAELAQPEIKSFDLSSLRTGIMAGSPCPVEVMKQVVSEMHMDEVTICYGMTETSPVSTQTRITDPIEKRVSTVGTVHPHVEIKIVDSSGHTVPRGVTGEFLTRGYPVMLGYWNDPEKTAESIDTARWMHTGDLATMDDEGYVYIVGRLKDVIIRGGENIYPREIEEFLYQHPKILDVSVVGVEDSHYGEEVAAWVTLVQGETATADEIQEFCKGKIAHTKIPKYIVFTDAFPMTVTGKVQKYLMREQTMAKLAEA